MIENRPLWMWQAFYGDAPYRYWDRDLAPIGRVGLSWHEARQAVISAYGFSIPTDKALDLLAERSPLIEIGAGLGFWAAMLADRGADIICFDNKPPRPGCDPDADATNFWWPDAETHVEVKRGTERMLHRYGDRTLLLSWPPYGSRMAVRALKRYRMAGGQTVAYIGEGPGGCCADDAFFAALAASWREVAEAELPQWDGIRDALWIYERA